jgi:hypothetical protein
MTDSCIIMHISTETLYMTTQDVIDKLNDEESIDYTETGD